MIGDSTLGALETAGLAQGSKEQLGVALGAFLPICRCGVLSFVLATESASAMSQVH